MEKVFVLCFPCPSFIPEKMWYVVGRALNWNLGYLELSSCGPPLCAGAGSQIISCSFWKLFSLPVYTLKLSVDFWTSLSANANPSELEILLCKPFLALGWSTEGTKPGRTVTNVSLPWFYVCPRLLACCWELPTALCWCEGTQSASPGVLRWTWEKHPVTFWTPVEFS